MEELAILEVYVVYNMKPLKSFDCEKNRHLSHFSIEGFDKLTHDVTFLQWQMVMDIECALWELD